MTVLLLFVSFFIQPFHQALANESLPEEPVSEPAVADEVKIEAPDEPQEAVVPAVVAPANIDNTDSEDEEPQDGDTQSVESDVSEETNALPEVDTGDIEAVVDSDIGQQSSDDENSVITVAGGNSTSAAGTGPPSSVNNSTSTNTSATDSGDGAVAVSSEDETDAITEAETLEDTASSDTNEDDIDLPFSNTVVTDGSNTNADTVALEQASTTEPVVVQAQSLVTDDNYYQFSKQSCVAVGDGTYHCTMTSGPESDPDAAVYAEQDTDGDMEIYLRTSKGEIKKLSDNNLDDTSPHYDAESMRVVWQRQINDRYQIIAYDLIKDEETQLTFSRTNNMEPKVSVEGIVWQAWDNHDWEVMYFDGTYTDQITDNDIQDVTPVVKDGYVLWSILGGEKQEARVYSIESGETMTISGNEGGSIVNPRFVLVYDTKFENGDIVTQGFDPATGLSSIIAAVPASDPVDIPEVDTTGEIRALIQNKSTQKEDTGPDGVKIPAGDDGLDLGIVSTSTASSSDTLNLKSPTTDIAPVITATTTQPHFELTDYDLVITRTATSTGGIVTKVGSTTIPVVSASSTRQ